MGGKEEEFGEAVVLAPGDVAEEAEALSAGHCCGVSLVPAALADGGIGYAGCSGDPQDAAETVMYHNIQLVQLVTGEGPGLTAIQQCRWDDSLEDQHLDCHANIMLCPELAELGECCSGQADASADVCCEGAIRVRVEPR